MVQMTIESPSFVKESMVFHTERDMLNWYLKLIKAQKKDIESWDHWSAPVGTQWISVQELSNYLRQINE